jgi:hypothetical protein
VHRIDLISDKRLSDREHFSFPTLISISAIKILFNPKQYILCGKTPASMTLKLSQNCLFEALFLQPISKLQLAIELRKHFLRLNNWPFYFILFFILKEFQIHTLAVGLSSIGF